MPTRGLSLLNPMNIMENPRIKWLGEIKPTTDPEGRLCEYDTFINGIRAGALTLLAYNIEHQLLSIREMITRFAPASENPTSNYIQFVADKCAVSPDDAVDLIDNIQLFQTMVNAIIQFEQGVAFCTPYQIQQGVEIAITYYQTKKPPQVSPQQLS